MATANFIGNDYAVEQAAIDRRRKLAEALLASSQEQPQGGMVGQVFVGASPFQHLAQLLKGQRAQEMMSGADQQASSLASQRQALTRETLQKYAEALKANPGDRGAAAGILLQNPDTMQAGTQAVADAYKPMTIGRSAYVNGQKVAEDDTWKQEQEAARAARQAESEAQRAARAQEAEQQRAWREQQAAQQREFLKDQQAARAGDQQALARLAASLRPAPQMPAPQVVTTPEGVFTLSRDGALTPLATPEGKPLTGKQPTQKVLPHAAINELSDKGATAQNFQSLSDKFNDKFGGYKFDAIGNAANTIKRMMGDDTEQAQWWQQYQEQKNITRNKLFGGALTATEKTEFDKAAITPGMAPTEIRKNLARQTAIAKQAAQKIANAYKANGFTNDQIESALGMSLDSVNAPAAQPTDIQNAAAAEMKRRGLK